MGRGGGRLCGRRGERRRSSMRCACHRSRASSGRRITCSSTRCRRTTTARSSRPSCAPSTPSTRLRTNDCRSAAALQTSSTVRTFEQAQDRITGPRQGGDDETAQPHARSVRRRSTTRRCSIRRSCGRRSTTDQQGERADAAGELSRPAARRICPTAKAGRSSIVQLTTHNGTHMDAPYPLPVEDDRRQAR